MVSFESSPGWRSAEHRTSVVAVRYRKRDKRNPDGLVSGDCAGYQKAFGWRERGRTIHRIPQHADIHRPWQPVRCIFRDGFYHVGTPRRTSVIEVHRVRLLGRAFVQRRIPTDRQLLAKRSERDVHAVYSSTAIRPAVLVRHDAGTGNIQPEPLLLPR